MGSVPQITNEIAEVAKLIQQERVQQRTVEEMEQMQVPQTQQQVNDVVEVISQEQTSERNVEPIEWRRLER